MRTMFMASAAAAACLIGSGGPARAQRSAPAELSSRNGTIVLKVADYEAARQKVLQAALNQGGDLRDARTQVNEKGKKHGWMRLRLAADRLPQMLPAVQGVGKLYAERLDADDHRSHYEELARRVDRLKEHEQRLDSILKSPRRMRGSDILFIQERLFRASVDDSLLEQRRVDIERAAQTCSLTVTLFEPGSLPPTADAGKIDLGGWFANGLRRAWEHLQRSLARGATAGAYVLVYAPLWIPALVLAVLLGRRLWRHIRAAGETAARMARTALHQWAEALAARRTPGPPQPSGPAAEG